MRVIDLQSMREILALRQEISNLRRDLEEARHERDEARARAQKNWVTIWEVAAQRERARAMLRRMGAKDITP